MDSLIQVNRRPQPQEHPEFFGRYIDLVPEGSFVSMLESQIDELLTQLSPVSEAEANTLHPPYTWTIKQVIGHLIDVEKVFGDRIHRFAAGELQPQMSFDHNDYVNQQDYQTPSLSALTAEWNFARRANLSLIKRIKGYQFDHQGLFSEKPMSVRALIWVLVGHVIYHQQIIEQRLDTTRE